jgi:CO/xanthine dehydrogenase Mo-binding subunit/aerobic-type carbon monoxide dehydrogenase small subunit (CoxS/CutS family)
VADPDGIEARVRGTIRYTIDVSCEGMAHAALVRSRAASGRIRSIETGGVADVPGVVRVVSAADLASLRLADDRFGTIVPDQPILAADRVRHVGEPVAAIVAETEAAAREAAARVRVLIDADVPLLDPEQALADGAPLIHEQKPGNVLGRAGYRNGDMGAAEARTSRRFEGVYLSPAAQQVTFEPQAVVARWVDGTPELWAATQSPSRVAAELARVFGIEQRQVRLHVPPLGGGYGAKNHAKLEPLVAALAALCGRPVRLVNTRAEEFLTTTKHPASVRLESGVDADGRFTYRRATIQWSAGAYAHSSPAVMRAGSLVVCGPYRVPAAEVESVMVYTNLPPAGSFRGLGANQAAWAGECQVDEIATALGIEPLEFRRRNVVRPGDRLPTGERVVDAHWLECLETAADGLGSLPAATRERRTGSGIALAMKHTMTPSRSEAVVAALPDGMLEVRSSLVDMGQGLRTVLARAAARALGVYEALVRVIDPDTSITPFDATTSSSRGTWAGTTAVAAAANDLRRRLEVQGAEMLGLPADSVRLERGRLVRTDALDGAQGMSIADIVAGAEAPIAGEGLALNEPPVDEDGVTASSSHWHQGAVAVGVTVDADTGVTRVVDAVGAAWAGRVIDAGRARLQDEGGIVLGLGPALWEELGFPDGAPSATSLMAYRIPALPDVPARLLTSELESGEPDAEPVGLGESLIPAVAPAIAAAVRAATGAQVRRLPLTPERVLDAIDGPTVGQAVPQPRRTALGADAPPAPPPVPDTPVTITFTCDGQPRTIEAAPLIPLRDVLADLLGIRSVRGPCRVGVCGACTVQVDGRAVRTCLQPVGLVAGADVVTSAGLPEQDAVVRAFVDAGAAQCGSCIPGMVLAAHDLLAGNPTPTAEETRWALAGNLCRCGTYGRILDAVAALSDAPGSGPTSTADPPMAGRSRS